MTNSEKNLEQLESLVPELSAAAVNNAYHEALAKGLSVYVTDYTAGCIFEIFPDGQKKTIKQIQPPLKIAVGTIFKIQK